MYTFHTFNARQGPVAFDAAELPDDDAATARADQLLSEHTSAHHVLVCLGDREVGERRRTSIAS